MNKAQARQIQGDKQSPRGIPSTPKHSSAPLQVRKCQQRKARAMASLPDKSDQHSMLPRTEADCSDNTDQQDKARKLTIQMNCCKIRERM